MQCACLKRKRQLDGIGMMHLLTSVDICWRMLTHVDHRTPKGGFAITCNGLQTTWQRQDQIHIRLRKEKDAYLAQLVRAWARLWTSSGCIRLQGLRLSSSQVAGCRGFSCSCMWGVPYRSSLCTDLSFLPTNPNNASSWENCVKAARDDCYLWGQVRFGRQRVLKMVRDGI